MQTLYAIDREEWRAWLREHYDTESEVWLVYYKKETGRQSIPYDDSVEEALCFGWIDSIIKSLDGERYACKFTPRKPGSRWSESNKRRVQRLIAEGRMTQAGLSRVDFSAEESEPSEPQQEELPDFLLESLMRHGLAWENFNRLAPSYRRTYVRWIMSARLEETRRRRLAEAIELLERNEKLGLK